MKRRITVNPKQCGGRPCIRGMRIRVMDVLDLFAAGLNAEQILDEMPDLEREDLQAALQYAARKVDSSGQDAIAQRILEELADDQRWDDAFARSQDALGRLAAKVRADVAEGKVWRVERKGS